MVSWIGDKYKFDFDVQKVMEQSVYYFGMIATVFYIIRIANALVRRIHNGIIADHELRMMKEAKLQQEKAEAEEEDEENFDEVEGKDDDGDGDKEEKKKDK